MKGPVWTFVYWNIAGKALYAMEKGSGNLDAGWANALEWLYIAYGLYLCWNYWFRVRPARLALKKG